MAVRAVPFLALEERAVRDLEAELEGEKSEM